MTSTLKLSQLHVLLELGSVLVAVDGRAVSGLPVALRTLPQVQLRIGHDLTPPIDLVTGVGGFSATLSFEGKPYDVKVPWSAVFVMVGEGDVERMTVAFPLDVPKAEPINAPPKTRGHLRTVD
jgi:hypothetical protein